MIFEMHTHTRYGSSCSYMFPDEMVQQAVNAELDGISITEHDIPWDNHDIQELSDRFGILVIGGIEVSTSLGEVLVWGLHEPIFDVGDISELRRRVDGAGGVMVAAHPFRGAHELISLNAEGGLIVKVDKASRMAIFDWVDAMEIFNGRAPDWELKLSSVVCDNLPIPGMGGSDAHNTTSVGDCVTVFQNRVTNEKEFLEEIKAGRYYAQHRRLNIFYPDNGKYQRKRSQVRGSEVQG